MANRRNSRVIVSSPDAVCSVLKNKIYKPVMVLGVKSSGDNVMPPHFIAAWAKVGTDEYSTT